MQPKNDPGGTRRGKTNERRAERALRERIGNPSWLLAVRNPTEFEDSVGVDLACRIEGVGEINVQVKSSEKHLRKFQGSYRRGLRGAVPIAIVVVRDDESNRDLGERIVEAVSVLRDEIMAEGREIWTTRKEREFEVRRALRFRTDDLDVAAAAAFMDLAERLSDPWPLWLQSIGHMDGFPAGMVRLETDVGFPLCLIPFRCKDRVERLRLAVGPVLPRPIVIVPVYVPEDANAFWIETVVSSKGGKYYQKLARYVLAPGRNLRQP